MRRIIAKTLIFAILLSFMLTVPVFADSATVTGDYVNFRSGPGLNYGVINCLRYGTSVTVTGYEGSWAAVVCNGESGYVSSQYISASSSSPISLTNNSSVSSPVTSSISSLQDSAQEESPVPSVSPTPKTGGSSKMTIVVPGSSSNSSGSVFSYGNPRQEETQSASPEPAVQPTAAPAAQPTAAPAAQPTAQPTASPAVQSAESQSGGTGYINGDYVRFRTGPSTSYTILGTYNKGKSLTILGTSGEWTKCTIDGKTGFVFTQYVKEGSQSVSVPASPAVSENTFSGTTVTAEETVAGLSSVTKAGYISGNNVRFRSAPSLDGDIIGEFYYANAVTITGVSGDWTAVSANGKTGYVYSQYVKEGTYSAPSQSAASANGQAVVDYAMQFLGTPYKWGGKDPSGFDCSGFVYYVFSHFDITLNRVAQDQASNGTHVEASDLQPGDILCFYSGSNYIGHVGIYIGDGKFIHSATSNTGVIITELSGYYTTRGFEARRIVN